MNLIHSSNFKSDENVRSSNVVEFELELSHISNYYIIAKDLPLQVAPAAAFLCSTIYTMSYENPAVFTHGPDYQFTTTHKSDWLVTGHV